MQPPLQQSPAHTLVRIFSSERPEVTDDSNYLKNCHWETVRVDEIITSRSRSRPLETSQAEAN